MATGVKSIDEFDFIVVGGGYRRCAFPGRLAESPKVQVLVIEAGVGNPQDVDAITTPACAFELRDSNKAGGSSCLNYYTRIPGSASTFDDSAPYGGEEWNWENCRQSLCKPATYRDDKHDHSEELMYIGVGRKKKDGELTDVVHNGTMRGLWKCTTSIYYRKRSSSWMYLEATKGCLGVEVLLPNGETHSFGAKYETIASSGVFESPKLLMLSGIGRQVDLAKFNIKTIVDSAHVGQNLLAHLILAHVFRLEYETALITICFAQVLSTTRQPGTVELNSADPLVQPKINLNFFANDLDILALREGIHWADDVLLSGEG
ncbi:hypothetical protein DL767_003909 [Monosporascus sp. MG133]|nr:hypothetical protein DL767_003909 [Monosporascus sp. MG133]